jgi:hypothetical protein
MANVNVIEETVYTDGSGYAGTLVVYGFRFAVIAADSAPGSKLSVNLLGGPACHGQRAQNIRKSAARAAQSHAEAALGW